MKYANQTIIQIAQERGSAAKTKSGAWKYLLNNLPKPTRKTNSSKYNWDVYREAQRTRTGDGRAKILGYDLNDPNTPGRICEEAWEMNRKWDADCRISIERGDYGQIIRRDGWQKTHPKPIPEIAQWFDAWELIHAAENKNIIPESYDTIDFDRKGSADGSALHHELYDMCKNAVIICIRRTEGTRYGVKTLSKTYMLIERKNRKITATETKITVAKFAKMDIVHFGDIISVARGEKTIKLIVEKAPPRHGFKAVRVDENGNFVSVWDGSPWEIGKTRIEKARHDHNGGLYYYSDLQSMIEAAKTNSIFAEHMQHNRLAVLEVEASGNHISYGAKLAATRITPLRQIASII